MSGIAYFVPALFNALVAAPGRPAGLTILQHAPASVDKVFPYLVVGELTEVPEGKRFRQRAWTNTVALHGFSEYMGTKEIRGIAEWLTTTLEPLQLTLTQNTVALLRIDSADITLDPDTKYHLLMRVRGSIHQS